MFWQWEKWGVSNRGGGGKQALADKPCDFEKPVGQ